VDNRTNNQLNDSNQMILTHLIIEMMIIMITSII